MKGIAACLVIVGFSVFASSVRAEQGCPDGFVPNPTWAQGQQQCIPGSANTNYDAGSYSTPGASRWKSKWGSIALDAVSGMTGVAGSRPSRKKAEKDSIDMCRKKGGKDCRVQISYANQCGVIAWGNQRTATANAPTVEEASSQALAICKEAAGTECEIFFSDCSLPERIQ